MEAGERDRAVVLLSGGMDSATAMAEAAAAGLALYALTFRYGQRHEVEVEAARQVALAFGAREHRVIALDPRAFRGSALTGDGPVPGSASGSAARAPGIPATYVPARNTIFLAYALGWAEILDAGHLYLGVTAVDYSGYPDCRPEYIEAFRALARLATKQAVEGRPVEIHAPLLHLKKEEIIRRGLALRVNYAITHSCYDPGEAGLACGFCDACRLRREGFARAGVPDPTRYRAEAAR